MFFDVRSAEAMGLPLGNSPHGYYHLPKLHFIYTTLRE